MDYENKFDIQQKIAISLEIDCETILLKIRVRIIYITLMIEWLVHTMVFSNFQRFTYFFRHPILTHRGRKPRVQDSESIHGQAYLGTRDGLL
jgi:hypothetical protein